VYVTASPARPVIRQSCAPDPSRRIGPLPDTPHECVHIPAALSSRISDHPNESSLPSRFTIRHALLTGGLQGLLTFPDCPECRGHRPRCTEGLPFGFSPG
jgi:hypothetical protein